MYLDKEPDLPALTSKKTSTEAILPYYVDRNLLYYHIIPVNKVLVNKKPLSLLE